VEISIIWSIVWGKKFYYFLYLVGIWLVVYVYLWGEVSPHLLLWITHALTHKRISFLHTVVLFYTQVLNLATVCKRIDIHIFVHR